MKTLHNIKNTLKKHRLELQRRFKVRKIGVFGSCVWGDDTETSDIDILVELYEPIGLEFVDLKDFLERILERKVDLVTDNALKPELRDIILKGVVYI